MALPQSLRAAPEAVALAVSFPALVLHPDYSPAFTLQTGQTSVSIGLADLALLVVAIATLSAVRRGGVEPLRGGRSILVPAALLLALVALATVAGPWLTDDYPTADKLVSAAKFIEYAVLLVAVPLIVRRVADARVVVAGIVATGVAATAWGLMQLIGLLPNLDDVPAGRRMPSFAGLPRLRDAVRAVPRPRDRRDRARAPTLVSRRSRRSRGQRHGRGDRRRRAVDRSRAARGDRVRRSRDVEARHGVVASRGDPRRRRGAAARRLRGAAKRRRRRLHRLPRLGRHDLVDRRPDLLPADGARLHRAPDLPRPSRGRSRLAGVRSCPRTSSRCSTTPAGGFRR